MVQAMNRSMKSTPLCHAQSLGSCILTAGVLPLLRLHCSCQGEWTLTEINGVAQKFPPERCDARTPKIKAIGASLLRAAHLSHVVTILRNETAKWLHMQQRAGMNRRFFLLERDVFHRTPRHSNRCSRSAS